MVRVPLKTESRRPNPESLARPGGRGRGPKTENRFCHFHQKNGPGTSEDRKPRAESRKLGPARREGQGPEDRKPKTVFVIFPPKMVRVPPKTKTVFVIFPQKMARPSEDRKPKAESRKLGPAQREGQGPEDRKPKTVFVLFRKTMVRVPPKTESRRPNPESLARPSGRGRGPKTENRKPCSSAGFARIATLSPKPGAFFRNLYTLHHAYPLMNHLSAVLRSAHSCAVPLSHSFGFVRPRPLRLASLSCTGGDAKPKLCDKGTAQE